MDETRILEIKTIFCSSGDFSLFFCLHFLFSRSFPKIVTDLIYILYLMWQQKSLLLPLTSTADIRIFQNINFPHYNSLNMSEAATHLTTTSNTIAYIVSKKFNSSHLEELINVLQSNNIPIQMHNDYEGMGLPLDRRYFVIVDNMYGSVGLGSWYASLLLFVVGYPKNGKNLKNHYCTHPQAVVQKYHEFMNLPAFSKKKFLSSKCSSKSLTKSRNSIFTISKHPSEYSVGKKSVEESDKLGPKRVKTSLNRIKKERLLMLYSKLPDDMYNKWILKITTNNNQKYKMVQSIQDLHKLSTQKDYNNYLLITNSDYMCNKTTIPKINTIVYQKQMKQIEQLKNQINVIAVCGSHYEIVNKLREIGFEVASLKDIDKSIVRYRNPLVKKQKAAKKIFWEKQQNTDGNVSDKQLEHSDNQEGCRFGDRMSVPVGNSQKKSYRKINIPKSPVQYKKRISIDNGINFQFGLNSCIRDYQKREILEQTQSHIVSIPIVPSQVPVIEPAKAPPPIIADESQSQLFPSNNNSMLDNSKNLSENSSTKKTLRKAKRLKTPTWQNQRKIDDKKSEKQIAINKNAAQKQGMSESRKNIRNNEYNPRRTVNSCSNPLQNSRMLSTGRTSAKNSETNDKQNISDTGHDIKKIQKTYRLNKIGIEQSVLVRKPKIPGRLTSRSFRSDLERSSSWLLWKQLNTNIQITRDLIKASPKTDFILDRSFYTPEEFNTIISREKPCSILLLIDDSNIQGYLQVLQQQFKNTGLIVIYIFGRETQIKAQVDKITKWLSSNDKFRVIVKPVISNEYCDESLQAGKEICSWLV